MSKIFVGLSGGVDSSVAATLLKKQGKDVVGVFMKNWTQDIAGTKCLWREDYESARSIASHLNIELKVYDFQKEYKREVIDYMIDSYKKGLTPNPDIMCNQEIKFKIFLDRCKKEGADKIATGHYARIKDGKLKRAKDKNKDQTYFLYRISDESAKKTIFPIGDYKKSEVRELAQKFNLPSADRPDSQGLCFVGKVPVKDFLGQYIDLKSGDILDEEGKKLGEHNGAFFFTIGQRHGLGVGGGKPYFVYDTDIQKNIVYVTASPESSLLSKDEFFISDTRWWLKPQIDKKYGVKVRYRAGLIEGKMAEVKNEIYKVKLDKKERAVTPGQSAVLYDSEIVVGGGIIL